MQCAAQAEQRYKSKYKKVGVLPIWIVQSNVSSIGPSSERNSFLFLSDEGPMLENLFLFDEGPMLETLDYMLSVLAVHRPFYYFNLKYMYLQHKFIIQLQCNKTFFINLARQSFLHLDLKINSVACQLKMTGMP